MCLQVELVINQLPQLPYGAHYMCVFGRSTPVQAKVTDHGLACLAPVLAERPPIPSGKGTYFSIPLHKVWSLVLYLHIRMSGEFNRSYHRQ